jgi:3-hydroxyacyl-CoA dehydrogenase
VSRTLQFENDGASLYDVGDGVACLELHTKGNSMDADLVSMVNRSLDEAERRFRGLVIGNRAPQGFLMGVDLTMVLEAAEQSAWAAIDEMCRQGQRMNMRLRHATVPTVTAAYGLTLGGGAEIAMHGAACQALEELYIGLVETSVGLIPGAGGCKELLVRALSDTGDDVDPLPQTMRVFQTIAKAQIATHTAEARSMGFLRASDPVTRDRARLLDEAKATVLRLTASGYTPPPPRTLRLCGPSGREALLASMEALRREKRATDHDLVVASRLAGVLCGTAASARATEEEVLDLEREAFVALCGEEKSRARMDHMRKHNRPLRN